MMHDVQSILNTVPKDSIQILSSVNGKEYSVKYLFFQVTIALNTNLKTSLYQHTY